MPRTIAIIDYGAGNLRSIQKALALVAGERATVVVTGDRAAVEGAAAIVLPGVGAAGATMRHLDRQGLIEPIRRAACGGRPFLGVCLGLQLLFARHEEDDVPGLDVLPGRARRLPGGLKVPHMGWNRVALVPAWPDPLLLRQANAPEQIGPAEPPAAGAPFFYFVHSYYVEPAADLQAAVAATTCYGLEFCSVLVHQNIWATQFHPEKSSTAGLQLLRRWVDGVVR